MSKKIIRAGNEFWIEGDWTGAAFAVLKYGTDKAMVNFSTQGSDTPEAIELRAKAILAACKFTRKLNEKVFDRDKLMRKWDREKKKFYMGLYLRWHPQKRKKEVK